MSVLSASSFNGKEFERNAGQLEGNFQEKGERAVKKKSSPILRYTGVGHSWKMS